MNIDWFTIVAQALNFIVLLWLMKRFLFKPILHAIDEREKLIAGKMAIAETEKTEARKQKEEYELKNTEQNRQSAAFLKSAEEAGQAERLKLMHEAREGAEALSAELKASLAEGEKSSRQEIGRRTRDQVLSITRRVLTDLADTSLEEQVIEVFNQRLRALNETEIKNLTSTLKTQDGVLTVRTALDMSPDLRAATEASIRQICGKNAQVAFENAPDMISGIELDANGQKVAWSIADYLYDIKESSDEFMKKRIENVKPVRKKKADGDEA